MLTAVVTSCTTHACAIMQVIYLDADNFVLKNPSTLFSSPEYNSTGAIFWQDYWDNTVAPEVGFFVQSSGTAGIVLQASAWHSSSQACVLIMHRPGSL